MRERRPAVYIMASRRNGTLYTGVTSDLLRRAGEHRMGAAGGFAGRYGCRVLVWFQMAETMVAAIVREKAIKAANRRAKLALIEADNPTWRDLYPLLAPGAEALPGR